MKKLPSNKAAFLRGFSILVLASCLYGLNQRDNVREAVLRHLVKPNSKGAVFVSFHGRDPGASFIRRFENDTFLVRKFTQGVEKNPLGRDVWFTYYVDKTTGRKGGSMDMGSVVWLGPFTARVKVDFPMAGDVFTVSRTWSGWKVTGRKMAWIS